MQSSPPSSKHRLFRRLLIKGATFSILFHLAFFVLFHIKDRPHYDSPGGASTVYLSQLEPSIEVSASRDSDEDPGQRYARQLKLILPRPTPSSIPTTLVSAILCTPIDLHKAVPPWTFVDATAPSSHPKHVYPVKIILHSSLRHFSIIDDGSSLFNRSSAHAWSCTPLFATSTSRTDFAIEISPLTGKVLTATCTKHGSHRILDSLASALFRQLQFHVGKRAMAKNVWHGVVSIRWYGRVEDICELISTEVRYD